MTGDIWFLTFYLVMTFRFIGTNPTIGYWFFIATVLSGLSHLYQAGMVDYYKTLHLHFLKGGQNSEFENTASIGAKYREMTWKKDGISKLFLKLYYYYTKNQELFTPQLKRYIGHMDATHPEGYPAEKIASFREQSLKIMPALDLLTFNARSVVMLVSLLLNMPWLYFGIEILVMNPLLYSAMYRHERMCKTLINQ
jgi:hypothetical protein